MGKTKNSKFKSKIKPNSNIKPTRNRVNKSVPNRPYGELLLDLEVLYDEMIDQHGVQMADILYHAFGHCKVHRPDAFEVYVEDGSNPELFYGPRKDK